MAAPHSVCTKEEKRAVTKFLSAEGVSESTDWLQTFSTVWEHCFNRV